MPIRILTEYRHEPTGPDGSAEDQRVPPGSWAWVGMVRFEDGGWRAVAAAPTLERTWQALLDYPGRLDRLVLPVSDLKWE